MKLGIRIFGLNLIIFIVCFYYPIDWVRGTLRIRYLEGVEDPLADQANILAAVIGAEMEDGRFDPADLYRTFGKVYARNLAAKIYDLEKTAVDMRVILTDRQGTVIFDSLNPENIGKDYSGWRDIRLTLQGKYGARTSLADPSDNTSSVLYVAAPVRVRGELAGVVSVAKPTTNIKYFLKKARPRIIRVGGIAAGTAALLSFLVSVWVTLPIKRLTRYANDIRLGRRVDLPKLDDTEISEMGLAFDRMKTALEGKEYVEEYVQSLTHEIKSPLSAIRGAAELLHEKMPEDRRERFLNNIRTETGRIQDIIDRMLELAALENRMKLEKRERVVPLALVRTVLESLQIMIAEKKLRVTVDIPEGATVEGDTFLLHRAIANLIQNAVDFSPSGGEISIEASISENTFTLTVTDSGPGIPDYAQEKLFDKFFSLQRPETGLKSTGLGLNFVKEVATLHNGDVRLENRAEGGAEAVLRIDLC